MATLARDLATELEANATMLEEQPWKRASDRTPEREWLERYAEDRMRFIRLVADAARGHSRPLGAVQRTLFNAVRTTHSHLDRFSSLNLAVDYIIATVENDYPSLAAGLGTPDMRKRLRRLLDRFGRAGPASGGQGFWETLSTILFKLTGSKVKGSTLQSEMLRKQR